MADTRADAHIHLFEHGYRAAFTARPGVQIDEVSLYESLMRDNGISTALIVGYARDPWCATNTEFLAGAVARHAWARPLAYVKSNETATIDWLASLQSRKFVGLSFYIFEEIDRAALARTSDEIWTWLASRRWLISVNARSEENWSAWEPILRRHPSLRVLVSHLGLPPRVRVVPTLDEARATMSPVLRLADFPGVHVKLSGFYALSDPGHDYPHRVAWPYVDALVERFGTSRLLWASDFSPCLDWLSFPQTMGVIDAIPFPRDTEDRAAILGRNLTRLLEEVM